jgi:serine/threonine protein kinase
VLTQNGYKLLEPIGSGAFAQVYKTEVILESSSLRKGQIIACKVVNLSAKQSLNKRLKEVKNELFILEKIRHPNIIQLYDHFMIGEKTLYILMQCANGGDLGHHLIKCGPFPEEAVKLWFAQILSTVSYMHSEGIAHRDLKLDNILLDHNNKALLTDFGLSRVCRRRPKPGRKGGTEWSSTFCGTTPYMAPEILMTVNIFYDPFPTDIWALGIILFILFNSGYPFDFNDKHKMLKQQLRRRIK